MKTWLGKTIKNFGFFALVLAAAFWFRNWYMTPNVAAGEPAKDFTALALNGKEFSLQDLQGRYVLLHFWGSWCGPCRRQNPLLVETAKQLGNKLVPVSIAIERDSSRWQAAIKRDGLFWPHQVMDKTSNIKFLNGPLSDLYGVNQVPTEFLLNPAGEVIATNPSFQEIIQAVR